MVSHVHVVEFSFLVNNINKLFDKSGYNLERMLDDFKPKIKNSEYEQLLEELSLIRDYHDGLITTVSNLRHSFISHIARRGSLPDLPIELIDVQELVDSVINFVHKASFVDDKEKNAISDRVEYADVMLFLGLQLSEEHAQAIFSDILPP